MSVVSKSSVKKLLKQTGNRCAYCGCDLTEYNCEVDHIIPKSKGGTGQLINLVPACIKCNKIKSNYTLITFKKLSGIDVFLFEKLGLKKGAYITNKTKNNMGITICSTSNICPYEWARKNGF